MIDYIKLNCELPPLEKPLYDEDSDTWDLYFEEKGNWHPNLQDDLICLPFESQQEATQIFNESLEIHAEEQQILAEQLAEKEAKKLKRLPHA
jgi:uncharacterized Rmd1/YagE family protein